MAFGIQCNFSINLECSELKDSDDDFLAGSIVAFLSIIPNILLLFVFAAARKKDRSSPMGVVHLAILAILDIIYGVLDTFADFPFSKVVR